MDHFAHLMACAIVQKDFIVTVHLVDATHLTTGQQGYQLVVFFYFMTINLLLFDIVSLI